MNKITLFASLALFFISSIGFSQNERIEFKPRPAEFELYEYRNDSIFPLKTPTQNTLQYSNSLQAQDFINEVF